MKWVRALAARVASPSYGGNDIPEERFSLSSLDRDLHLAFIHIALLSLPLQVTSVVKAPEPVPLTHGLAVKATELLSDSAAAWRISLYRDSRKCKLQGEIWDLDDTLGADTSQTRLSPLLSVTSPGL